MKPIFTPSWEEIGEENQVEETFSLSTMKDIPGKPSRAAQPHPFHEYGYKREACVIFCWLT